MNKRTRVQTPRNESMVYEDDPEYGLTLSSSSSSSDDWENDSGEVEENFICAEKVEGIQTVESNDKIFNTKRSLWYYFIG